MTTTDTTPTTITLTDGATAKVAELLAQEGNDQLALRVAVRPGGCSGYSYEMFFDTDVADDDIRQTFGGVPVVVDAASAQLLTGATLEYRDGLQGAGFSISTSSSPTSRILSRCGRTVFGCSCRVSAISEVDKATGDRASSR